MVRKDPHAPHRFIDTSWIYREVNHFANALVKMEIDRLKHVHCMLVIGYVQQEQTLIYTCSG